MRLEVEPVPQGSWGLSLANKLPKDKWDKIRHEVYKKADYTCSICEDTEVELHAHETWRYSKTSRTKGKQTLVDIICVCKVCHDCIHFGRSVQVYPKDYISKLVKHFCKVNGITKDQMDSYLEKVKKVSSKRADVTWTVVVGRRILL